MYDITSAPKPGLEAKNASKRMGGFKVVKTNTSGLVCVPSVLFWYVLHRDCDFSWKMQDVAISKCAEICQELHQLPVADRSCWVRTVQ